MQEQQFRDYLMQRGLDAASIAAHEALVEEYAAYLAGQQPPQTPDTASAEAARDFVAQLGAAGRDNFDNVVALCRYGYAVEHWPLFCAMMEQLDGSEVLGNLYARVAEQFGAEVAAHVISGDATPGLGAPGLERARLMRGAITRLRTAVGDGACAKLLSGCLRDLGGSEGAERKKYVACGSFDAYLELKRDELLTTLRQLRDSGKPWFTQPITDAVVEFVAGNPEIATGLRMGDVLYVTKIPYMTQLYLDAQSDAERRYYCCHCPWARELLLTGEAQVPAVFCHCSGGFIKKPWEDALGCELEVELLESVLQGDPRCRFAVHLPAGT